MFFPFFLHPFSCPSLYIYTVFQDSTIFSNILELTSSFTSNALHCNTIYVNFPSSPTSRQTNETSRLRHRCPHQTRGTYTHTYTRHHITSNAWNATWNLKNLHFFNFWVLPFIAYHLSRIFLLLNRSSPSWNLDPWSCATLHLQRYVRICTILSLLAFLCYLLYFTSALFWWWPSKVLIRNRGHMYSRVE